VREDHVEMDGGRLLRHDHHDQVRHFRLFEQEGGEAVDTGWTGAFAEADEQHILAQGMYVPALEGVIESTLDRAVVQDPAVGKLGVRAEQSFHDQLFRPSRVKSHRADHHVLVDRHRGITSEKEIRQRRQRVARLVERA
jgi:hypothetical protein